MRHLRIEEAFHAPERRSWGALRTITGEISPRPTLANSLGVTGNKSVNNLRKTINNSALRPPGKSTFLFAFKFPLKAIRWQRPAVFFVARREAESREAMPHA